MTPQDRFRLGFLMRCADEGCPPEEVRRRTKQAEEKGVIGKALNNASSLAGTFGWSIPYKWPTALGLAAATIGGPMVGYTAAKMQERPIDPEEAKKQELIAALRLQAEQTRRRASQRSYRQPIPRATSFLQAE